MAKIVFNKKGEPLFKRSKNNHVRIMIKSQLVLSVITIILLLLKL